MEAGIGQLRRRNGQSSTVNAAI